MESKEQGNVQAVSQDAKASGSAPDQAPVPSAVPTVPEATTIPSIPSAASASTDAAPNPRANLYVNNVATTVTEDVFRRVFQPFGTILRCRLATDKATGQRQEYGFVQFAKEEEALLAIRALNGLNLVGKNLEISVARERAGAETGQAEHRTNVYVANIPKAYTNKELNELFAPFGTIMESCVLTTKPAGESRGVGFVRFATAEQAMMAIAARDGKQCDPKSDPLIVKFARDDDNSMAKAAGYGPIHAMTTSRFNPMGRGRGRGRGVSPGLSRVFDIPRADDFRGPPFDPYAAQAGAFVPPMGAQAGVPLDNPYASSLQYPNALAMNQFPGVAFPNMGLQGYPQAPVGMANPMQNPLGQVPVPANADPVLFVFYLPPELREADLQQLFQAYGEVVKVAIARNPEGQSRGYGFVTMRTIADAQNAIKFLNGHPIGDKHLAVSFKAAKGQASQRGRPAMPAM